MKNGLKIIKNSVNRSVVVAERPRYHSSSLPYRLRFPQ